MDETRISTSRRGGAVALLLAAGILGGLAVTVAYGVSAEYGDTAEATWSIASGAVLSWSPALLLVALVGALASAVARRALVMVLAAILVVVTGSGVAGGSVLGVQAKYDMYEATPGCAGDTDAGPLTGPAAPVLRRAEAEFAAIDHPGPFTGGGRAGVNGCESGLVLRDGVDPATAYRDALPEAGWDVVADDAGSLQAEKGNVGFRLRHREDGWVVWIGPRLDLRGTATARRARRSAA